MRRPLLTVVAATMAAVSGRCRALLGGSVAAPLMWRSVALAEVSRRGCHSRRCIDASGASLLRPRSPSSSVGAAAAGSLDPRRWRHRCYASSSEGGGTNGEQSQKRQEVEPTLTFTPFKPPPLSGAGQRRRFSSGGDEWRVPNGFTVPLDRVETSFIRSSGAGGQNVNKLNTKVEVRFLLSDATWIPAEVRDRLKKNEANRINKEGYMAVTSQEYRTQAQNRKDAMKKLEEIILKSWPRPKVRKMRKGVSKAAKERNKEQKRRRSQVKASRKRVDY